MSRLPNIIQHEELRKGLSMSKGDSGLAMPLMQACYPPFRVQSNCGNEA